MKTACVRVFVPQNGCVLKTTGIIFCALIFLAGCVTQPPASEKTGAVPSGEMGSLSWDDTHPILQPGVAQTNHVAAVRANNQAASVIWSNPPPVVVRQPAPIFTWTALANWAAEYRIGKVHLVSSSPVTTYAVGSSNGVMVLEIGSREATWIDSRQTNSSGVEINLGFAPELIDDEIYLHGLDLEKNLKPLLCGPPLTFPTTNRVIVIDPGHGGSNTGTHSVLDGRFEKEFTLDTALRLKPLLEAEGWTVFLTRTSDVDVANSFRPIFATAHHADLFISLHFNATDRPDPAVGGLETYCFTPTGMPSTVTRGYADPWTEKLSSNDFDAQNLQLAVKMQGTISRETGLEDRGVRHVRFIEVLRNQHCPAVLIENGYLSNPAEAQKIESAAFRQKLAQAIADALK